MDRPAHSTPMEVTIYGRPGCHLCDDALEALRGLAASTGGFGIREVDIESDDVLMRRFLEKIPVLEVDGEVVSELESDPAEIRTCLVASGLINPVRDGYADK